MTTEREMLVVNNLALAHYMANKYRDIPVEFEEIISSAYMGLVKAALTFDVSKGYAFATYAGRVISNEILMFARSEKRKNTLQTISMETKLHSEEDITIADTLCDKRNDYERIESFLDLKKKMEDLEDKDRMLITVRIENPNSRQEDIAKICGISQSYISRRLKTIKEKLA